MHLNFKEKKIRQGGRQITMQEKGIKGTMEEFPSPNHLHELMILNFFLKSDQVK